MTAIICIAVRKRKGKPFILIASDSMRSHTDQPNGEGFEHSEVENNAKKVFKIHNKLVAVSGSFTPAFQGFLINSLLRETTKQVSADKFMEIIAKYSDEYISKERENVNLNIITTSIVNGKPMLYIYTRHKSMESNQIEFINNEDSLIELLFGGVIPPEFIKQKYNNLSLYGDISPIEVRKIAVSYLKDMKEINPESCNEVIQSELLI